MIPKIKKSLIIYQVIKPNDVIILVILFSNNRITSNCKPAINNDSKCDVGYQEVDRRRTISEFQAQYITNNVGIA